MGTDEFFKFEKLKVWQESRTLVKNVYALINEFPSFEKFALCDQLRRAVVSISSNLAEGSGRMSSKEKIRFIEIAYGSLMEVYCQLILAQDLGYLAETKINEIKPQISKIAVMLSGLRKFHIEVKD